MGFSHCRCNVKALANELNLDENVVKNALNKSRVGGFARIFSFTDRSTDTVKSGVGSVSVSKKAETGEYVPSFQDGFVSFFGEAYSKISSMTIPEGGISIIITNCDVTNNYVKQERKNYINFVIYDFDVNESNYGSSNRNYSNNSASKSAAKSSAKKAEPKQGTDDDSGLPF